MNHNKEAKSLTFRRGSEVGQATFGQEFEVLVLGGQKVSNANWSSVRPD